MSRGLPALLYALTAAGVLALVGLLLSDTLSMNLDGAMYLEGAMTLLEGGHPYVDFVDINPPLAIYLHVPPVLLAQLLNIDLIASFYLFLLAATYVSCLLCFRLLTVAGGVSVLRAVIISITPALLLVTVNIDGEIGQRSHLFALALGPYLLLRVLRANGKTVAPYIAIFIGICIALTVALKPIHYAAIVLPAELYLLIRYRNFASLRAPEILAATATLILYGVHFLFLPADSLTRFFTGYLPVILESYGVYGGDPSLVLAQAWLSFGPLFIVSIIATLVVARYYEPIYRDIAWASLLTVFAATFIYFAQGKGWGYHSIPIRFAALLTLTAAGATPWLVAKAAGFNRLVCAAPLAILALACITAALQSTLDALRWGNAVVTRPEASLINEMSAPEDRVVIVTTAVGSAYPLLIQMRRRSGTRFGFMFPVPFVHDGAEADRAEPGRYRIAENRQAFEQEFLRDLNDDLRTRQPELILFDTQIPCQGCPENFGLQEYLLNHRSELPALADFEPAFMTARFAIWRRR